MTELMTTRRPEDLAAEPPVSATEPLTNLRGAKDGLDVRRVGAVFALLCLVGVVVLVISLFVAGADRNSRISNLQSHGVGVEATVTGCRGLLGGSGSNGVGYVCNGTITVDGHRYAEVIPGNSLYATGDKVPLVMVAGDPGLISTPQAVANDRASWKVFILPSVLLLVSLAGVGTLAVRRKRTA